jgi:hypothetical protein
MGISRNGWAIIAGVAFAAALAGLHHGYQNARRDPGFCTDCHADTAGLAGESVRSHRDVSCQSCHPTGTSTLVGLIVDEARGKTGADTDVTPHGERNPQVCADCHADTAPLIGASAGHKAHREAKKPTDCVECHGKSAHTGRPDNESCVSCHKDDTLTSSAMADVHCLACHDYLGPQPDQGRRPGFGRCESCHGGKGGRAEGKLAAKAPAIELHAEMPCATCHQPHKEPFTVARACETCHEQVNHAHPEVEGRTGAAYCTTCHGPHDDWQRAVERCQTCHEDVLLAALPARASRVAPIGDELLDALAAQAAHVSCVECHPAHAQAGEGAMRASTKNCPDCHKEVASPLTHPKSACNDCHAPHTPQPKDCGECHAADVRHGTESCRSCHRVHPDKDFVRPGCESCHKEKLPAGATEAAGGHPKSACVDCHTPHKPEIKGCASCHETQVKAVVGTTEKHRDCKNCHTPHVWKAPTCAECHEEQAKAVAPIEKHRDCAACHPSHQGRGRTADLLKACASCHEKELAQAAPKHRECFECHEPHAGQRGKAVKKSECVDCHEAKFKPAANLPKHVDCAKCHQVHVGPGEGPPKCNTCHEPGALKSGGALHVIKEHQVCSDCHRAHGGFDASRDNCTRCHEKQKKHEPKAPVCNGCHNFR